MAKTKASDQPARRCDLCGFTNKNAYIFKRHRLRCRRDKKTLKGGITKIKIKPSGASLVGTAFGSFPSPVKVAKENGISKRISPSTSPFKRNRTYTCEECNYSTIKSKAFLYHQIQEHKKAYSIFTCTECEYSSKHRHKVQRHLKLVHKKDVDVSTIKVEFDNESIQVPEEKVEPENSDPRFKYNIDMSGGMDEQIPDDVVVVLPEAPEGPSDSKDHVMEVPGIEGKVYKCEYCLFNSNDKSKVAKHVVTNHLNAKMFQCSMCSFTTGRKIEFVAHKAKHRKLPALQCSDCTYATDNKQNFDRHRENHKADHMYRCQFCSFSSSKEAAITRHIQTSHENSVENMQLLAQGSNGTEPSYMEPPLPTDLQEEMAIPPGGGRNFVMGVQNTGTEQYYAHNQTYSPSPSMDYSYNNTDLMGGYSDNSMNWSQDSNNSFNYSPSTPAKRGEKLASKQAAILQGADGSFVCPLCGLKYKRSSDLNRHMKQKHEIRMKDYLDQHPTMVQSQQLDLPPPPPSQQPQQDMLPPPPPLMPAPHQQENVEITQNEYTMINDNIPPLDNQDESFGEISMKCNYCPYEAKWPGDIRKHLAIHQIERRYRCPHCEKQYKYVGDLNVHIRKDHKREPEYGDLLRVPTIPHKKSSPTVFKCPSCPFSSQWKAEVDRHTKCHGENKPYKCNYCEYQTHWKGDIRRHMYNHHPEIMGDQTQLDSVITIDYEKLASGKDLNYTMDSSLNSTYENNTSMDMFNDTPENSMDQSYDQMNHGYEQIGQSFEQSDMSFMDSEPSSVEPSPVKEGTPPNDGSTEPATFRCEYCSFVTNAPSKLKAHVSTHMNLKQYMCPICGRRANWKWDIRKHIKKTHPETGLDVIKLSRQEAEATIANYLNSNPVVRREHHLNVTVNQPNTIIDENSDIKNGKMFKCGGCGYESNQRWIVSKHIRTVHAGSDVSIIYKGSRDSHRTMMNIPPNETHMPPMQPESIVIDDGMENNNPIQTTILNVPMINNEARDMQQKARESQGEKPFICMDCGKQCASKADIARHYYYMHRNMPVKVGYITENGIVPLEKDDPGPKSFVPKPPMQKLNETSPEKFLPLDIKPFMCAECGKRAALKGDVKKHYNYMHPGSEVRIVYVGDNQMENGMIESPYLIGKLPEGIEERPYAPKMGKPKAAGLASANPKSFGYTKPFMCSECGRRSNWKWDLSKHMRMRHPGSTAHIITLSEAEARATYESYMQEFSQSVHTSPVKKHPSTKANEKEYQLINFNRSAYRQFKCSACPYRSNWRSDLLRHIKRKHGVTKGHLIILTIEEAKESLTTYDYNPRKRRRSGVFGATNGEGGEGEDGGSTKPKGPKSDADKMGRIWKCARCSFVNKDKMVVARHLYSSHRIRAFTCTKCHYATNHRSSAYRHIKQRHETENISICKIGIKYIRYDPSRHTYVKSAIEKAKAEGINIDLNSAAAVGENGQLFPGWENNEILTDENLTMEEDVEDDFVESMEDGTDEEEEKDEVQDTYVFKETFQCRLCTFQSSWRSCVCRHIRQKHKSTNYQRHIKSIKKIVKNSNLEEEDKKNESQKQYLCTVCPYRTAKNNLLTLHMNCHKPQLGVQQEKCRYCPYYVKAPRLIQQHERLHLEEERKKVETAEEPPPPAPPTPTKDDSVFTQPPTPSKRYQCQKCPYRTNSKSDFFYHKQFHRPKPSAEYKCDECDYWVGLKRLLKQHKKVHEADYNDRRSSISSVQSSPCKSDFSESSYVYDSVQLAMYKQKVIASKIQPSISHSPVMSPMKIACTVGNRPGYVMKNGGYRKVHKCSKCPYQNIRLRNLKLHELMHGLRKSKNQLMKCPDCDYYVGSKGLLSHHMKVHLPGYMAEAEEKSSTDPDVDEITGDLSEKDSDISEIMFETKVDTLYEIARFKKYSCEKCPYASAKRSHYEKHVELHGSKQRHACKYCDYSVPSRNLLVQHERLHCTPNQNLLAIQSLSNLLQLPEVPADVALASALPPIDTKQSYKVSVTHDHIDLYENSNQFEIEPKKLYRCDRCPYANVRRDHLLTHLKFHMLKSVLACPYCDYSVSKQHHLAQHIRVHFCPLPELSNWLAENGQLDRVKQSKDPDISEALFVAQLFKRDGDKELEKEKLKETGDEEVIGNGGIDMSEEKKEENGIADNDLTPEKESKPIVPTKSPESDTDNEISFKDSSIIISPSADKVTCDEKKETKEEESDTKMEENGDGDKPNGENGDGDKPNGENGDGDKLNGENGDGDKANGDVKNDTYICQYCDREFDQSDVLVQHEMQHLIGNNYEVYLSQFASPQEDDEMKVETKNSSLVENVGIAENGDIVENISIAKNDSIAENGVIVENCDIVENGDISKKIPEKNKIETMEVDETKENTSVNS